MERKGWLFIMFIALSVNTLDGDSIKLSDHFHNWFEQRAGSIFIHPKTWKYVRLNTYDYHIVNQTLKKIQTRWQCVVILSINSQIRHNLYDHTDQDKITNNPQKIISSVRILFMSINHLVWAFLTRSIKISIEVISALLTH